MTSACAISTFPRPVWCRVVRGRNVEAVALVDHRHVQQLGELDEQAHARRRAGETVGDDDRVLRIDQQPAASRTALVSPCGGEVGT